MRKNIGKSSEKDGAEKKVWKNLARKTPDGLGGRGSHRGGRKKVGGRGGEEG